MFFERSADELNIGKYYNLIYICNNNIININK